MQRSLDQFDLSAAELDILKRALTDAAARKPAIDIDEWGPKIEGSLLPGPHALRRVRRPHRLRIWRKPRRSQVWSEPIPG